MHSDGTFHQQVSYGIGSSQVLEEIIGTTARSAEVETSLTALFSALDRNELDTAKYS